MKAAGFSCVGVVEVDDCAAASYRLNFPDHIDEAPLVRLGSEEGDARLLEPRQVRRALTRAGVGMGVGELDLLVAGPPCQGFSHVGRSKLDSLARQRGAFQHDERNRLYLTVTDLVPVLRPRALLIENVPGILSHARVNVAERIAEVVEEAGYECRVAVLNAAWYGVPQTRERVFVLAYREDLGMTPTFPAPSRAVQRSHSHLAGAAWVANLFIDESRLDVLDGPGVDAPRAVTVREAIADLPSFTRHLQDGYSSKVASKDGAIEYPGATLPGSYDALMRRWDVLPGSEAVLDHYARRTPRDHETFRRMRPGDRYPEAVRIAERRFEEALSRYRSGLADADGRERPRIEDFVPPYPVDSFVDKWRKLIPGLPSWTVTAHLSKDSYSHIHFDDRQARSITPREAARIQSFPDAFRFVGNMGDTFRQIGNAVPPLLARAVAQHLLRALGGVTGTARETPAVEPASGRPARALERVS